MCDTQLERMKLKTALLIFVLLSSCKNESSESVQLTEVKSSLSTENYEIIKPQSKIEGLLILFGGFPESASDIKNEFQIHEIAIEHKIAVILMNFNRRLWLEENEKVNLSTILTEATSLNNIPTTNTYIGGFSSGGNVSLLLTNYLMKNDNSIKPKGVFIIDSPVDLLELYKCSERNIIKNFSKGSVQESQRTVSTFDEYFGKPEFNIEKYESLSPYTYSTNVTENLKFLKDLRIRMYTEPDTVWWKTNRMNDYEDMNAYYIKNLAIQLKKDFNQDNIELIETENKGKRANGYRHPHSWSIVDKEDLISWMLKE